MSDCSTDRRDRKLAEDCPCTKTDCPIHGDCVECVGFHRSNANHLPECMQVILRQTVVDLAEKVEFKVVEGRPHLAARREG